MMKNRISLIVSVFMSFHFSWAQQQIIPQPQHYSLKKGPDCVITAQTKIYYDPDFQKESQLLIQVMADLFQVKPAVMLAQQPTGNFIYLKRRVSKSKSDLFIPEQYHLSVNPEHVLIEAMDGAGIVHGIQTLIQLMPIDLPTNKSVEISQLEIEDFPTFQHRGLLLDCGRHFMKPAFIKQTLDIMSMYKMNVFHWHLTEDQGWRIEIKKYPKLTEVGAYRIQDGQRYGGYYTQQEIREIVEYANRLHITIIPEIELPGHSSAAIASYPYLSCTGQAIPVETEWGVFKDIYCAGNDQTLQFIYDVMDEVCQLFPGKYIHIGGDEAPKVRWEHCNKCQKRMKENHLKEESNLQTWLIEQVAIRLKSKGKSIIGWDEILEGGIPGDAVIQSWRGMQGGIDAARKRHGVIMSPTSHCYFDYGLDGIDTKKVYEFEPIPNELTPEQRGYIWGGECNMWTERAPQELVHSKILPRMLALSEVLWTHSTNKDYDAFEKRVKMHFKRMDKKGIQYGFISTPLQFDSNVKDGKLWVELKRNGNDIDIAYRMNSQSNWQPYREPFVINGIQNVEVKMNTEGTDNKTVVERKYAAHQGLGKELKLNYMPSNSYSGGGYNGLLDGRMGTANFRDGIWQAVQGKDMEMVVDLGSMKDVKTISTRWFHYANAWIFRPQRVEYWGSIDGVNWKLLHGEDLTLSAQTAGELVVPSQCPASYVAYVTRYVKVVAKSIGKCPDWHDAPGEPSWLFCDEIIIE